MANMADWEELTFIWRKGNHYRFERKCEANPNTGLRRIKRGGEKEDREWGRKADEQDQFGE